MSPGRRIQSLVLINILTLGTVIAAAIALTGAPTDSQRLILSGTGVAAVAVSILLTIALAGPLSREVREIQERFEKYYDVGLVGIADTSLETGWLRFNDRLCNMLGYSREELKATNWVELTHPSDLNAELREFRRALNGESDGYSREKRFIRKDGSVFHAITALRCVRGGDGKVDYFITFLFDINPRIEAEDALRKSQKELARAQELSHLGSWNWEIRANRISWSDETYRIFSMKPQEFEATYEAVLRSVHPEDRPIERNAMGRALLNPKQKYSVEYRVVRPDKSVRFVHLLGEIIRDDSGEPLKMEGFIQDITDYKRIESQLRDLNTELEQRVNERTLDLMKANTALRSEITERIEVEGMLRTLIDSSPDHILTVDRGGVVQFHNSHPTDQFPDVSDGSKLQEIMTASVYNQFGKRLGRVFDTNKATSLQVVWDNDSWWEVRMAPIHRENGTHAVMMVFTDITEKRTLQVQAIRNARLASLGVLAASVAHEINNPNNAIGFSCSSLANFWTETVPILKYYRQDQGDFDLGGMPLDEALETVPRLISGVGKNVDRVKKIVENLKHMGRQDEGRLEEELDVFDLLRSAVSILNTQIRKHTDRFEMTCDSDPIFVRGNAQQLEQVFINLIQNGLQALPGRDKKLNIETRIDPVVDRVFITISDQGDGIPQGFLDRITTPFFTTKGKTGGMGLGLSITDTIVKNHSGQLTFESQANVGTTATVQLPIHRKQESKPDS
ncbi:MAG: PAS domain-containing protein [Gammaproteobacteria bacterium]|nr:PAS domain-containing protein [Gammaproteobacteria bacterium]